MRPSAISIDRLVPLPVVYPDPRHRADRRRVVSENRWRNNSSATSKP